LAAACKGQESSPTETQTEMTPSPTPNVAMYEMLETDTNGDRFIGILDLMDQRKGQQCLECENFDFDSSITTNDALLAKHRFVLGKYNRRLDINNDGKNSEEDFEAIEEDIGKVVPSNGSFRADNVEIGWPANEAVVRFELGSNSEATLSKLAEEADKEQDKEKVAKIKAEIKAQILKSLGLNLEWQVKYFIDPPVGFTVTLEISPEVLGNMTLPEILDLLEQKPDVAGAFRNNPAVLS